LPFGHGRQFALHGPLDQIVGGWRISSIFQWHSGIPFSPVIQNGVRDAIDPGLGPSFGAGSQLYPDVVGDPRVSNPNINQWFNPAAYANPATGTFGDARRNSLVGPGFTQVDLSLAKEFRLYERLTLELRADAYNAFNHTNYNNPDANVGYSGTACPAGGPNAGLGLADCTAGTITAPAAYNGSLRIIQVGAHVRF